MGQGSSANIEHLPPATSVAPKQKSPPKRPTSPPQPKTPNYVVAQNKVLPGNIPLDGRSNLRPVSQELVKFMPEIADIYQLEEDEGLPMDYETDKENRNDTPTTPSKSRLEGPVVTPGKDMQIPNYPNGISTPGDSFKTNGETPNNDSGIFDSETTPKSYESPTPRPSNGLSHLRHNNFDNKGRIKGHRRQQSMCTSLLNEQSTIPEDPREHLYNEWRKDPYSNSLPSGTSLPVKSNFDMDESFNLTYAQLAEARRKKTLEELEKRTGKKIQDLTDDLADKSTVMQSPFDRYSSKSSNYTTSFSVTRSNSISTASSDTGVSKRKKKRAPPPPNQNGVIEPPVDYHLDLSTNSLPPRTKRQLSIDSSSSNVSSVNSIPVAPPPPVNPRKKGPAPMAGRISPRKLNSDSDGIAKTKPVSRSSSFKTPPVLPKPERQLSELELRLQSVRNTVEEKILKGEHVEDTNESEKSQQDQKDETTSMSTDTVSSMSDNLSLYSIESRSKSESGSVQMEEAKPKPPSTTCDALEQSSLQPVTDESFKAESPKQAEKKTNSDDSQKKLSSLLQHDIITAAQARGAKIKKQTTPVASKPKDQNAVFKEQLGKALGDREDRMKKSKSIDEMLSVNRRPLSTNGVVIKPSTNEHNAEQTVSSKVKSPVMVQRSKSTGNIGMKKDLEDEDDSSKRNTFSSTYSEEWTPEHDLDSDEDMNAEVFRTHQRATSEGFKSQIIPGTVKDLKNGSQQKSGKKNRVYKQTEVTPDEKNKYGSIRKLKKTVHKGVKNAFGSLSRASGKILRRSRNSEGEMYNNASNWSLNQVTPPVIGVEDSDSDDCDTAGMGVEDVRFDLPDDPIEKEPEVNQMKRASVAYVSGNGQIVLLPDFPAAKAQVEDDGGRAPKIYKKKKKKMTFESTLRKQELHQMEEQLAEQIKAKELEIEKERTKQMEMELEYRRLRDLDSQEKLQRLQTEHMQQQLNSIQQHRVSAPITPPAHLHNFNQPYYPSMASGMNHTPQLMTMNFNPTNSLVSNVPQNFTSNDVNQLSEYMRLMGVPPPSTPQQWTYLLNSVNFTSVPTSPLQHSQSMYLPTSGPDLSRIFTKRDPQINQKQNMMHVMTAGQQTTINSDTMNGQMSLEKRKMIDLLNGKTSDEIDNAALGNLLSDFHNGTLTNKSKKDNKSENTTQRANPVYFSSDEEDDDEEELSPAKTEKGFAFDQRQNPASIPNMVVPTTGQIVYDSVGYKTVIFNPGSPFQR
ncbi:hypothetical protein LOTGIDRAFT_228229 [Lottia gigantea]|uniref:Uncharacterized protein n=1 Tax=Lottia gigantea TaxID=225164 RepID=V4A193_LOTGI|nr:hypothetical protein LOTGIDRAFT_228229 [Lottia gigantea]ESO97593.1 hypothetical protein LOTGIDRAFT_228229 [Lottia gigantea]